MSDPASFDWRGWYERFSLEPTVLFEVWPLYPQVLAEQLSPALDQDKTQVAVRLGPLSDENIEALLDAAEQSPDLLQSFDHYLEVGELQAAAVLAGKLVSSREQQDIQQQRRMSRRQQQLEQEYGLARARLDKLDRDLTSLGAIAQNDAELSAARSLADTLFRLKRLGPAVDLLKSTLRPLEDKVGTRREELKRKVRELRSAAGKDQERQVSAGVLRLLSKAEAALSDGRLWLAESSLGQARVAWESGDLSHGEAPPDSDEQLAFRDDFPNVRAKQILDSFDDRGGAKSNALKAFFADWCPDDWNDGAQPGKGDPTYTIYEALRDLNSLRAQGATPFGRPRQDPWQTFLKDLFDLLGKRGLAPQSAEPISVRESKGTARGFWLTRCGKELSIPRTFLDPARLPDGLPVIIWHRPSDPLCPKPANLQNELDVRGLSKSPLLILAGEAVYSEDRDALVRAVPTGALLDERDLLQVIFCDERPEVRARHFARAIARQLPSEIASPFSEQGDVASSMFVGRHEVLTEFLNPLGPTVLYGGRKLGKSSIFRQLQREFTSKEGRQGLNIAVYVNAINVVDDTGIERTLLPQLAKNLNEQLRPWVTKQGVSALDLWIAPQSKMDCDDFANRMRDILRALPDLRLLFLIDEADSLLQYLDTPNDPAISRARRFGWTLRGLVQESGGRVDVRFAGFQEISRAAQSPSGPFYNFRAGRPQLALTVLEAKEARQLVMEPLQLLAASFGDESLVDFVLGVTGQHPALIQEFCRRLYQRIRTRGHTLTITEEDVQSVWQDAEFRKSVVRAVHLNVETRNTKSEKILRLLLYLWVRETMAPSQRYPQLPLVCQPAELYQLMSRTFGAQSVERQVKLSELDNYLSDLATLGVLEKTGRGYVFRYRYFASLLYYDYLGGQLGDSYLAEQWQGIVNHKDEPPRLQIQVQDGLSVSPFTRSDHAQLEQPQQRVRLVVGSPGTGKSEFFRSLANRRVDIAEPSVDVRIIEATNLPLEALRGKLSEAMGLEPVASSWQQLADQAASHWALKRRSVLTVVDGVDHLARDERWPLLSWPTTDRTSEDEGLLAMLARLTRNSEMSLGFALVGSFSLARLWVEAQALLADSSAVLATQRLGRMELDAWFETARLVATPDVKAQVWELTNGDWRLLSALRGWLKHKKSEEPDPKRIGEFGDALRKSLDSKTFPELLSTLSKYDDRARKTLKALGSLAIELGNDLTDTDWAEWLADRFESSLDEHRTWSTRDWLIEMGALQILQEVTSKPGSNGDETIVSVPTKDTWFRLVTDTYV